jgi:hypothetical protein
MYFRYRSTRAWCLAVTTLVATLLSVAAPADERIDIRFDATAAEAVLDIVERTAAGEPVPEADWRRLFAAEAYRRLEQRETAMQRPFTEAAFRDFVLQTDLASRAPLLRRTLMEWRARDLEASARRVLAWLPAEARIRATVYVVIKPQPNSFVYDVGNDPAIFLYLDPEQTAAAFENTVAHELHHIGFASLAPDPQAPEATGERARLAVQWMSAFGEGFAMLAAAGDVGTHPHAVSPPQVRERWDRDMDAFNANVRELERFFLDILEGRLEAGDELQRRGMSFFGVQGPWYTVGYRMAVIVERRFGREALLDAMRDPRLLLARYNAAAAELNQTGQSLALWSKPLLEGIAAG